MATPNDLASRHLFLRLRVLQRSLRAAVARQAADAARLDQPELANVCVTDLHVAQLLDDVERRASGFSQPIDEHWTPDDVAFQERLREEASERGEVLPIDRLARQLSLSAFEQEILALCAAAELDRRYERIFAYIQDDAKRIFPTVELASTLTARSLAEQTDRRVKLGRFGLLRRTGLIEVFGDIVTELRACLRLGPGVLEFLLGTAATLADLWRDSADVIFHLDDSVDASAPLPVRRVAQAIADGRVNLLGLWGRPAEAAATMGAAVARRANRPARRWMADSPLSPREQVLAAIALEAVLLVDVDLFNDPERRLAANALVDALACSSVPCILTGSEPWRPTALLASRWYTELELPAEAFAARAQEWRRRLPDTDAVCLDDLASRFRLSNLEVHAAARLARLQAALDSNGRPVRIEDRLDAACAIVARKHAGRMLRLIQPRRGPDDLILAPELYRQILEISTFTRALPRVTEAWGFGRLGSGAAGIKALFTGDPGTGKTLAAEVIAFLLAVPLLKIDIAQTVSKWLGETSKNLDEAFDEAAASRAVLFIDEADALCGKRGDVKHGVDRYANIEVSHLLQRLEEHDGLVILASNLKENIDPAFLRRFQAVVHFPRPTPAERCRLWRYAFPPEAPLASEVALEALARFDMTGAGIVGAARTAALLAAEATAGVIGMVHVVQGIVRQYRREGRMLTRSELGAYAALLQEK